MRPGSFAAECLDFKITFIGVGGHITTPELCIDPLQVAIGFYNKINVLKKQYLD